MVERRDRRDDRSRELLPRELLSMNSLLDDLLGRGDALLHLLGDLRSDSRTRVDLDVLHVGQVVDQFCLCGQVVLRERLLNSSTIVAADEDDGGYFVSI